MLCRLADIPDGQARGFVATAGATGGDSPRDIVVARCGGQVHGYVNRCPHVGTPLDWTPDRFMTADGRHLLCATHGAIFQVEDGLCLRGPCAGARLTGIAVRVEGDAVVLE